MTRPGGPNTLLQTINIFRTGTYRENENATVTEKKLICLSALSPAARPASPSNRSAWTSPAADMRPHDRLRGSQCPARVPICLVRPTPRPLTCRRLRMYQRTPVSGERHSAIEAEPSSQPKLGYCPIRVRAQRFLSCVSGAIREVRCRSPSGPHANLQAVAASVLHRLDKKLAWEAAGNGSLEN